MIVRIVFKVEVLPNNVHNLIKMANIILQNKVFVKSFIQTVHEKVKSQNLGVIAVVL